MPEFSLSENASGPLPTRLSDGFNAKLYPLNYAKTQKSVVTAEKKTEFIEGETRLIQRRIELIDASVLLGCGKEL